MKKVRVLIPGHVTVTRVENLILDLKDERLPARVERKEDSQDDYLVITVPGEISDDDLVKLGMFIYERLFH